MGNSMEGKVAVVTGASRGIGEAIARRMAGEGAVVAVTARTVEPGDSRFEGSISETVDLITKAGGTAIAVAADLSKQEDRSRLVEHVTKELGPIDVLVNNAAVTFFEPVSVFSERHYDLMFQVQVRAPFELAQLVLPSMKERKSGWILNISSGAARHPQAGTGRRLGGGGTVYGMCKAALERFTTGLAAEVFDDGIAVNVLSPAGIVATPGVVHHKLIPPGREDMAEPVEVIAEAALALCTGTVETLTGRITYSKPLIDELGRTAQPLDSNPS
ncbi:MAG TPA: SDR family NAD(P)-dependent oxidoreductase [Acidimicrobiales bacterium]|nr:SDR family NAD(P)-dependent oxidoreductase [Acidimicrobiales bacterium]